jgi:uncharacterized protein (TIGR03083 family)
MNEELTALEASAARLRNIVEGLDPEQLTTQAYPSEWTIADVLSHVGSGAVIMLGGLNAQVTGEALLDGYNQSVWDEWNSKQPADQARDALAADRALLDAAAALTDEQRAAFHFTLGPMSLDLTKFLGMRLNEHSLHTWDIEVVFDPSATLPAQSTELVVDNLELVGRFGAKPDGKERVVTVHTTKPDRDFTITSSTDAVSLTPSTTSTDPDLELPAEAFVRLVYGRLDHDHVPRGVEGPQVDSLRSIFPGL